MTNEAIIHNLEQFESGNRVKRLLGVWFYLERDFMTNQCNVMVFRTDTLIFGKLVYCIVSRHLNNNKVNVRFGSQDQIESIIKHIVLKKNLHC